jgi:hypothetical protein
MTSQETAPTNILNALLARDDIMELACYLISHSSARTTLEQRKQLLYKMEQDTREQVEALGACFEELTVAEPEVKPDTLLENSCGVCGASFVDYGERGCTDDTCLYDVREVCAKLEAFEAEETPDETPVDNWVQCDICDSWRKVETTEGLPNKWECSNIGKACRPPREAENYWSAIRAKRFTKYYSDYTRAPSHMKCLQFLAERKSITLEELYKTDPATYIGLDPKSIMYPHYLMIGISPRRYGYGYY